MSIPTSLLQTSNISASQRHNVTLPPHPRLRQDGAACLAEGRYAQERTDAAAACRIGAVCDAQVAQGCLTGLMTRNTGTYPSAHRPSRGEYPPITGGAPGGPCPGRLGAGRLGAGRESCEGLRVSSAEASPRLGPPAAARDSARAGRHAGGAAGGGARPPPTAATRRETRRLAAAWYHGDGDRCVCRGACQSRPV